MCFQWGDQEEKLHVVAYLKDCRGNVCVCVCDMQVCSWRPNLSRPYSFEQVEHTEEDNRETTQGEATHTHMLVLKGKLYRALTFVH